MTYLKTDYIRLRLAYLMHYSVGSVAEVEVAMIHILEHEILRVAVRQNVVGQDLELEGPGA